MERTLAAVALLSLAAACGGSSNTNSPITTCNLAGTFDVINTVSGTPSGFCATIASPSTHVLVVVHTAGAATFTATLDGAAMPGSFTPEVDANCTGHAAWLISIPTGQANPSTVIAALNLDFTVNSTRALTGTIVLPVPGSSIPGGTTCIWEGTATGTRR